MLPLQRVNRIAMLAILPLMALVIVAFKQTAQGASAPALPRDGTLVVAELRSESLTFIDLANGQSRQLAVPGPVHELVTDGAHVYATLGRGNALIQVALSGASVTSVVPLQGEPHGLALSGESLLVTLDAASGLLILDRSTLTGTSRETTGDTPHAVATGPQGTFVTDSRDNRLRKLPSGETVPTGEMPESVTFAGDFVVTADNVGGTLTVLRAATLAPYRTIAVGLGPVRAVPLGGDSVAVALAGQAHVALVNVRTGKVEKRLKVLARPDGICLNADHSYAAVISNEANAVQIFRVSDWRLAATLSVGNGPGACLWLPLD